MTRTGRAIVVLVGLCVVGYVMMRVSGGGVSPSRIEESASADSAASGSARLQVLQTAGAAGVTQPQLTDTEAELFDLYDEMVAVFEREGSCFHMGKAVQRLIRQHQGAIERSVIERQELGPEGFAARQLELGRSMPVRLAKLRGSLETTVARCKKNLQLRNALRELARMNAPEDRG